MTTDQGPTYLQPSRLSPGRRNGVIRYLQRYLDTVSDWRTYSDAGDAAGLAGKIRETTQDFFGTKKLKGLALLLAAHLAQQATASAVSLLARTFLRGPRLAVCRGLAVRQSPLPEYWQARAPAWLGQRLTLRDGYYFLEGGRTWSCLHLRFTLAGRPPRDWVALSLLGLPNRSYYFDRPLPYPQAVELSLGLLDPDSIPGFIGDTNELDGLIPVVRALKLGLYGLSWLLVDPVERDEPGPDVAGYDDFRPPPPLPPAGWSSPPTGGASAPLYPRAPTAAYPPPPPPPPFPDYGYPVQPGLPGLGQANGGYDARPQPVIPRPVRLAQAPVNVRLSVQANGRVEETWFTLREQTYLALDEAGNPTGLAVAPAVEALADGRVRHLSGCWVLVHQPSGYLLTTTPLQSVPQVQELAGLLAALANWNLPLEQLPAEALKRAEGLIRDFLWAIQRLGNK